MSTKQPFKAIFFIGQEAPREVTVVDYGSTWDEYYTKTNVGMLVTAGIFPIEAREATEQLWKIKQDPVAAEHKLIGEVYNLRNKYIREGKL